MRRSKVLLAAMLGGLAIGVSALAHRTPDNPDGRRISPFLAGAQIDPETLGIVERACQNCHSERTQWPWYSHVPPVSWLIHRDVDRARDRLNLTQWGWYSSLERQALLSAIGAAARTGVMPPRRYTFLHPEGDLSRSERERLYGWTRAERLRLRDFDDPAPMSGDTRFLWDRRF
jgi:hypothetical protein